MMRNAVAHVLGWLLAWMLSAALWLGSPRRRQVLASSSPSADACVFCWQSLGTCDSCLMCEVKRREDSAAIAVK